VSTLLFLHGVGGGHAAWDRQLPYFTARGYRALAWMFLIVYALPLMTYGLWRLASARAVRIATA